MTAFCPEEADTGNQGFVTCDLPAGHEGLHYDELYDISWTKGRPGGQV